MVEPRKVLGAMRSDLTERGSYVFHPRCRAVRLEEHAIVDVAGARWEADLVIVATGAAFDQLEGTERLAARLRRVRLQMMETVPFAGRADDIGG